MSGFYSIFFKHGFPILEYHESEYAPDLIEKFPFLTEILCVSLIRQIRQLQDLMSIKGKQVQHERNER